MRHEVLRLDCRAIKVWLFSDVEDWSDETTRRFTRLFRQAWRAAPPSARESLWRHWRPDLGPVFNPMISVCAGLVDPLRASNGQVARATTGDFGCSIRFSAFAFTQLLRDREFVETVSHELAHCYRWATLQHSDDYNLEEKATDNLVKQWLQSDR
jgi:hypothetical protein